jgi:hypothetical protein
MRFSKTKLALALAGLALFGAQSAWADPNTGQTIMVNTTPGRIGSGGAFLVTGGSYAGPSFETFCVETNEFLTLPGGPYTVTKNTGAVGGGAGFLATYAGDVAGVAGFDPISKATGWLYSAFRAGGGALTGWGGTAADKADLQVAIWALENEVAIPVSGNALTWFTQGATNAASYSGGTYVMNLTVGSTQHQDLLAIPEPETYAMLLAGLGLMGFVARRRQRKLPTA